jgi:hypothetical protein
MHIDRQRNTGPGGLPGQTLQYPAAFSNAMLMSNAASRF